MAFLGVYLGVWNIVSGFGGQFTLLRRLFVLLRRLFVTVYDCVTV